MSASIELARDYSPQDLQNLARRLKNANQSRRLLALAPVLDGHHRAAAAEIPDPTSPLITTNPA